MTIERGVAGAFGLTDANWMRHANPASVWTRYSVLPFIVAAFWSRAWIGWWCLVPGVLSVLWVFLNPLLFAPPKSTKNWASRAVLGERVYLNRDRVAIPDIHRTALPVILNCISSIGMAVAIWAVVVFSVWGAVLGVSLAYLGKSWYLDRMVWLYETMKCTHSEYGAWEY